MDEKPEDEAGAEETSGSTETLESIVEPMSLREEEKSLEQSDPFGERKKIKFLPILAAILIVAIIGGGGFWAYHKNAKKTSKSATNTAATDGARSPNTNSAPATTANSADDQLDRELTGIDTQFKMMDNESKQIDAGLADQPEDLNE